jgi:hypothetical protein
MCDAWWVSEAVCALSNIRTVSCPYFKKSMDTCIVHRRVKVKVPFTSAAMETTTRPPRI